MSAARGIDVVTGGAALVLMLVTTFVSRRMASGAPLAILPMVLIVALSIEAIWRWRSEGLMVAYVVAAIVLMVLVYPAVFLLAQVG